MTPQPSSDTNPPAPTTGASLPKWPSWFRSVDISLGLLAATVAFLAASFVARNQDFWRHIGTGRALLNGGYSLGSDPLTYTGEGRPWVNFSWLAEVGMYLVYTMDSSGAVVVAVKAILFAGAFAALFLLRKPSMPLLPWALAILLASIGAAPFAMLRPYVLGLVCFASLLVLLFRGNWTTTKPWRMPLCVGGLVMLWTNLDSFSFLGTLAVLLLAIGETLHAKIFAGRLELSDDEDPLLKLPATKQLWRTAAVCAVAMLLNPTFLIGLTKNPGEAIAQLVPMELDWGTCSELAKDKEYSRQTFSLLKESYLSNPILGKNLPTFVSLAVIVLCALSMAIGYRHGRASHVLLWTLFCLLAMIVHAKFIAYAMIVSAPFLAANLNGLMLARFKKTMQPQTEQLLIFGSVIGRVLALIIMALAIIAAFPGWLQVRVQVKGYARYVGWGTDQDYKGLRRAAELVQEWRTSEKTKVALKDLHGVNFSPEFGDTCAWFAPAEKSFINSRIAFHRTEFPDLITIREELLTPPSEAMFKAIGAGTFDFTKQPIQMVMAKYNASFLCVSAYENNLDGATIDTAYYALASSTPSGGLKLATLWHLDGRFFFASRTDGSTEAAAKALKWEPGALIFGKPTTPEPPDTEVRPGMPEMEGWAYDLLQRKQPQSLESFDAMTFQEVSAFSQQRLENQLAKANQVLSYLEQNQPLYVLLGGGSGFATMLPPSALDIQLKQDDIAFALPLLTIKQAMAATSKNPNDPKSYLAQAFAYQSTFNPDLTLLPGQPSFRQTAIRTGLNRALTRYPTKDQLAASPQVNEALAVRQRLLENYFKQNLNDAARAELLQIIDLRTAAKGNAANYDRQIPRLWENTLFNAFKQDTIRRIQYDESRLKEELSAAGGKPAPELQRKIMAFQQLVQLFQQDPYTVYVKLNLLDEKDHPKNFYNALQSGGKTSEDEAPTDNEVLQTIAIRALTRLNELLAKFEAQMVEEIKRSIQPGVQPADVFKAYIARGLPMQAINYFNQVPENERDVSFRVLYMELLYYLGKIEQCHNDVFIAEAFDPSMQRDPAIIERLTALRLQRELLLGDYFKADQTAMQLLQSQFTPLTEAQKLLAVTDQLNTSFAAGQLMGMLPFLEYDRQRTELANRLYSEANFTFRRGVMCLLRGNVPDAKRLFDLADQPQGIPLSKLGQSNSLEMNVLLPKYRELIKKYAK